MIHFSELFAFLLAAVALLGSPGPAIAALLAVGRAVGWNGSMQFFWGLQLGLASAAAITAVGLFAALAAFPLALAAMSLIATIYLVYLAFKIATSPIGEPEKLSIQSPKGSAGFIIGITNPKAYLAFASLFAPFRIWEPQVFIDGTAKWLGVVVVMISVDIIWLWIGVTLGRLQVSERSERILNYAMAAAILFAAGLALL